MTKICVITGGRMDYGHLYKVMQKIYASKLFQLQVIATCMHLSPEFGLTFKKIEADLVLRRCLVISVMVEFT